MAHDLIATDVALWTYRDAVDHLMDVFQLDDVDLLGRRARRAVDTVYRDMPYRATWSYYRRNLNFSTTAPQTAGTIAYDASTRIVTLSGETWPSVAAECRIQIGNLTGPYHEIERRVSSTEILLAASTAPAASVVAGTSYRLFRSTYQLPYRFREVFQLWDTKQNIPVQFSTAWSQFAESMFVWNTPQTPFRAIITNGSDLGWMAISLSPPPDSANTYVLDCSIEPRPLRIVSHADSATVDAGSDPLLVTVDRTLPENIVGSVIRLSGTAAGVTSRYGDNPPLYERVVTSRESSTTLKVHAPLPSLTDVGCVISDPIDIEPGAMLTAFQRGIELEYAKIAVLKDIGDREELFRQAFLHAVGSDRRTSSADSSAYPVDRFSRVQLT